MISLQTIYEHAPVWLQNLMCLVKGGTIVRRRYGKEFFRLLSEYENHSVDGREELQRFLEEIRYVPAYKQVFANAKDGKVKLADFPIITKADVKAHYHDYLNTAYNGPVIMEHTSGTTGGGLVFPCSVEGEQRQWAVWWRFRESLGIKYGTWCGWFGGRQVVPLACRHAPYWRINRPGRQVMFSTYHLKPETVKLFIDEIARRKMPWLHGFPSILHYLCKLAQQAGLPQVECVRYITTGAENLLQSYVEIIKKTFPNAIVRTHYGLGEAVSNISQTKDGEWMTDDDFAITELIETQWIATPPYQTRDNSKDLHVAA